MKTVKYQGKNANNLDRRKLCPEILCHGLRRWYHASMNSFAKSYLVSVSKYVSFQWVEIGDQFIIVDFV